MSFERLVELRTEARADRLRMLRAVAQAAMAMLGADRESSDCVVLAVNEACMNVIQHAYGAGRSGEIVLEILNNRDQVKLRVRDFAAPVDPAAIRPRDLDDVRPGGLGVHLIREVMDEANFVPPPDGLGNILEMTRRWRPAADEDRRDEIP